MEVNLAGRLLLAIAIITNFVLVSSEKHGRENPLEMELVCGPSFSDSFEIWCRSKHPNLSLIFVNPISSELVVPNHMRYRPVKCKELLTAVAASINCKLTILNSGDIVIIERGISDELFFAFKRDFESLDDIQRRVSAVWRAGWYCDSRVIPLLTAATVDPNEEVAEQAIQSLIRLGLESVVAVENGIELLFKRVENLSPEKEFGYYGYGAYNEYDVLLKHGGVKVLPLFNKIYSRHIQCKINCLAHLNNAALAKSPAILSAALNENELSVQIEAMLRFQNCDINEVREKFCKIVENPNGACRLFWMKGDGVYEIFQRLTAKNDSVLRFYGAVGMLLNDEKRALSDIGRENIIRFLVPKNAGKDSYGNEFPFYKCLRLLSADIGQEVVERYMKSSENNLRLQAAQVLGAYGNAKDLALIDKTLNDPIAEMRAVAAASLRYLNFDLAFPRIMRMTFDDDWKVRSSAKASLGAFRSMVSKVFIETITFESDRVSRDDIYNYIVNDYECLSHYPLIFDNVSECADKKINRLLERTHTINEAGWMSAPGEVALVLYGKLLTSTSTSNRVRALSFLEGIGGRQATNLIADAILDPDQKVREFAMKSLRVVLNVDNIEKQKELLSNRYSGKNSLAEIFKAMTPVDRNAVKPPKPPGVDF